MATLKGRSVRAELLTESFHLLVQNATRMLSFQFDRFFLVLVAFYFVLQSVHNKQVTLSRSRKARSKGNQVLTKSKANKPSINALVDALQSKINFNIDHFKQILNSISIPRNVNTNGHKQVRKFIESTLQNLGPNWHVEEDSFSTVTPIGPVKFRNIISTYLPSSQLCGHTIRPKVERIVLACHYDSLHPSLVHQDKSLSSNQFIGATDAAVSCSLLLSLAQFITPYLNKIWSSPFSADSQLTIQLVFFDGEEALLANQAKLQLPIKTNSVKSNSLFGSRHLAKKWEYTFMNSNNTNSGKQRTKVKQTPKISKRLINTMHRLCKPSSMSLPNVHSNTSINTLNRQKSQSKRVNGLENDSQIIGQVRQTWSNLHDAYHTIDNIRLFLLLDLVGGTNPRFFNTNLQTTQQFRRLAQIEKYLLTKNLTGINPSKPFFQTKPPFLLSFVRDDHLPFVVRNVSVLHLIPHPFPRIWHRVEDNLDNVNFDSIRRLLTVLQVFLLDSLSTS